MDADGVHSSPLRLRLSARVVDMARVNDGVRVSSAAGGCPDPAVAGVPSDADNIRLMIQTCSTASCRSDGPPPRSAVSARDTSYFFPQGTAYSVAAVEMANRSQALANEALPSGLRNGYRSDERGVRTDTLTKSSPRTSVALAKPPSRASPRRPPIRGATDLKVEAVRCRHLALMEKESTHAVKLEVECSEKGSVADHRRRMLQREASVAVWRARKWAVFVIQQQAASLFAAAYGERRSRRRLEQLLRPVVARWLEKSRLRHQKEVTSQHAQELPSSPGTDTPVSRPQVAQNELPGTTLASSRAERRACDLTRVLDRDVLNSTAVTCAPFNFTEKYARSPHLFGTMIEQAMLDRVNNAMSEWNLMATARANRLHVLQPLQLVELCRCPVFAMKPSASDEGRCVETAPTTTRGDPHLTDALNVFEAYSFYAGEVLQFQSGPAKHPSPAAAAAAAAAAGHVSPFTQCFFVRRGVVDVYNLRARASPSFSASSVNSSGDGHAQHMLSSLRRSTFHFPLEVLHFYDGESNRPCSDEGSVEEPLYLLCTVNEGSWFNYRPVVFEREQPRFLCVARSGCDIFAAPTMLLRQRVVEPSFSWLFSCKMRLNALEFPTRRLPEEVERLVPPSAIYALPATQASALRVLARHVAHSLFGGGVTIENDGSSNRGHSTDAFGRPKRQLSPAEAQLMIESDWSHLLTRGCPAVAAALRVLAPSGALKWLRQLMNLWQLHVYDASEVIVSAGGPMTYTMLLVAGEAEWIGSDGCRTATFNSQDDDPPTWVNASPGALADPTLRELHTAAETVRCRSPVLALSLPTKHLRFSLWMVESRALLATLRRSFPGAARLLKQLKDQQVNDKQLDTDDEVRQEMEKMHPTRPRTASATGRKRIVGPPFRPLPPPPAAAAPGIAVPRPPSRVRLARQRSLHHLLVTTSDRVAEAVEHMSEAAREKARKDHAQLLGMLVAKAREEWAHAGLLEDLPPGALPPFLEHVERRRDAFVKKRSCRGNESSRAVALEHFTPRSLPSPPAHRALCPRSARVVRQTGSRGPDLSERDARRAATDLMAGDIEAKRQRVLHYLFPDEFHSDEEAPCGAHSMPRDIRFRIALHEAKCKRRD